MAFFSMEELSNLSSQNSLAQAYGRQRKQESIREVIYGKNLAMAERGT